MLYLIRLFFSLSTIAFIFNIHAYSKKSGSNSNDESTQGSMSIVIKDDGLVEMKKGDVALIFYMTASNTGREPIHLFVNSSTCCQKITEDDEDCESMKLFGGDMGELFPQDTRNLTLIYANLYLHNREGSCTMEITSRTGDKMNHEVKFDTKLLKAGEGRIPRLLENYYNPDDLMTCESVDEDPLNLCHPYPCFIRYDGSRNFYNHTTKRCEKLYRCMAEKGSGEDVAYVVETNSCKTLLNTMTQDDFAEFHEGKPSVRELSHAHSYPINVNCHNGKRDPKGRWCHCKPGWDSAPFDHAGFNPDVQVYHMCTVWTGEMSAEEARNITVMPKDKYKTTNIVVFTFLITTSLLMCAVVGFLVYKKQTKRHEDVIDDSENMRLTGLPPDSDTENEGY